MSLLQTVTRGGNGNLVGRLRSPILNSILGLQSVPSPTGLQGPNNHMLLEYPMESIISQSQPTNRVAVSMQMASPIGSPAVAQSKLGKPEGGENMLIENNSFTTVAASSLTVNTPPNSPMAQNLPSLGFFQPDGVGKTSPGPTNGYSNSSKGNVVGTDKGIMTDGKVCPLFTNQSFVNEYGDLINPPIGKGAFGSVHRTQKGYIAKMFKSGDSVPGDFIREVTIIVALNKRGVKYVTPFIKAGVFHMDQVSPFNVAKGYYPWMVLPLGDGNITSLYKEFPQTKFEVSLRIAEGLKEIHDNNIIHRDIKPANILFKRINREIVPWINDFGLSAFNTCVSVLNLSAGTLIYMAPELFQGAYSYGIDVWAYGLVLLSLLSGIDVFQQWIMLNSLQQAYATAGRNEYYKLTNIFRDDLLNYSKLTLLVNSLFNGQLYSYDVTNLLDLVARIFVPMANRISMIDILNHSFFQTAVTNSVINIQNNSCHDKMMKNIYVPTDNGINDPKRLDYLSKLVSVIDFRMEYLSYLSGSFGLMDSIRISNDLTTLDLIIITRIMIMNYDGNELNLNEVNLYMKRLANSDIVTQRSLNDSTVRFASCVGYQLYYTSVLEYVHAITKETNFKAKYANFRSSDDVMFLLANTVLLIFDPVQCRGLSDDLAVDRLIKTINEIVGIFKYGSPIYPHILSVYRQLYKIYKKYMNLMLANINLISYLNDFYSDIHWHMVEDYLKANS